MGKRKAIVRNRLQMMTEGKRKKRAEQEAIEMGADDEEVEVSSVRSFNVQYTEEEDTNNDVEPNVEYTRNDDGYEIDGDNDAEANDVIEDGSFAPSSIFVNGIAIDEPFPNDPRNGDGLVIEIGGEHELPYLARFNGQFVDLWQVAGSVWEAAGREKQITVGITRHHPATWARGCYNKGVSFMQTPTLRVTCCRCVLDALKAGFTMNIAKTFSFRLYIRTKLLAEKFKGMVRNVTSSIHKGESVDDTKVLIPFYGYIERKLFEVIEELPPFNQNAVIMYLRQQGWIINDK